MKRQFLFSLATHAVIAALLLALVRPEVPIARRQVSIEIAHTQAVTSSRTATPMSQAPRKAIDLRPNFMRGDLAAAPTKSPQEAPAANAEESHALLFAESKVSQIFDQLAARINGHLEFPEMLAENGIAGAVTLDIYFDHHGEVDESRSQAYGGNKFIRGLLVKATREALVEWIPADATRLRREQFRDQHFRADMVVVHSQLEQKPEALAKTSDGFYALSRTYVSATACVLSGGVDLACLALRAAGAIHRATSDKYKVELLALKDSLETFDNLGLSGITREARAHV